MDAVAELRRRMTELLAADAQQAAGFAPDQLEDLLALIILLHPPAERGEPSPAAAELVGGFFSRAGVSRASSPEQAAQAALAYAAAHPPPSWLVIMIAEIALDFVRAGAIDGTSALARFAGEAVKREVLATGARPPGTIPAGPLAAFAARQNKK